MCLFVFNLFLHFLQLKVHTGKLVIGKNSLNIKNFVIRTTAVVKQYILSKSWSFLYKKVEVPYTLNIHQFIYFSHKIENFCWALWLSRVRKKSYLHIYFSLFPQKTFILCMFIWLGVPNTQVIFKSSAHMPLTNDYLAPHAFPHHLLTAEVSSKT